MDYSNRTALVTGASSGLGREYCRWLAARGANLIVIARRAGRLRDLARELEHRHGVRVKVLCYDLAQSGSLDELETYLRQDCAGVDILVNNAGYGVPGQFLSNAWSTHAAFRQVMVTAVARLSYICLHGMRQRGSGLVLNIASVAGYLPGTAGHTEYAAVKAWMINFSESLAFELAHVGIQVCAVCPGLTHSEFHDRTGTRRQLAQLPRWLWMEADEVVRQSFAAVEKHQVVFIPGWINRMIVRVARWLPRNFLHYIARRQSGRFRDSN